MKMFERARCAGLALIAVLAIGNGADGVTVLHEAFPDDPIANGRATVDGDGSRFPFVAPGALNGQYDTSLSTSKLLFSLGQTVDETGDFSFSTKFTINSADFFAHPSAFAQVAFGLVNSATTGGDRAGGGAADSFDIVTFDYFANITGFGGPSIGPSVVETDDGGGDFFSLINFGFGSETALDDPGELPLPLDTMLTTTVQYDSLTSVVTLSVDDGSGPLTINAVGEGAAVGGPDGDTSTVQLTLPAGTVFSVDSFAITLWEDTFGVFGEPFNEPSLVADVTFHEILVDVDGGTPPPPPPTGGVPEPASAVLVGMAMMCVINRRRR